MNIKSILSQIQAHEKNAPLHARLLNIYSGNLHDYIKADLSTELSPTAYNVASKRIPSINMLERIVNKLSKVYSDLPKRAAADSSDTDIIQYYVENSNLQDTLTNAEILLNLNKCCAIEPYVEAGTFQFRVLAAHEFCVLSNDDQNPNRPTIFVKFMGSQQKGEKKIVNIYWLYTADSFLIMDSEGEILQDELNPYGTIPFVYLNADSFSLMPRPDVDSYNNALIVPKLLTDLNYAVQYQSHSIMYGIDVDAANLKGNPDSFWSIQSSEGENKKPQLGVLTPSVDVDKVLALIAFTVSEWLSCSGIKPGSVGSLTADNAASGISKIVDESETSAVVDKNRILLVKAEKTLWQLISIIHNSLLDTGLLLQTKGLSNPINVSISFPVQQPIKDPNEARTDLKFKLENKLTSYVRALKTANPDMSEAEIIALKAEIELESAALKDKPVEQNMSNEQASKADRQVPNE